MTKELLGAGRLGLPFGRTPEAGPGLQVQAHGADRCRGVVRGGRQPRVPAAEFGNGRLVGEEEDRSRLFGQGTDGGGDAADALQVEPVVHADGALGNAEDLRHEAGGVQRAPGGAGQQQVRQVIQALQVAGHGGRVAFPAPVQRPFAVGQSGVLPGGLGVAHGGEELGHAGALRDPAKATAQRRRALGGLP
jgi:hypothetical protein